MAANLPPLSLFQLQTLGGVYSGRSAIALAPESLKVSKASRRYAALKAANPRSRSALRSSTFSSPIWSRNAGPPGAHLEAVRYDAQSNGMTRLSKPPQE